MSVLGPVLFVVLLAVWTAGLVWRGRRRLAKARADLEHLGKRRVGL